MSTIIQKTEVRSRYEKEILQAVLDVAIDGIVVVDRDGYIIMISEEYKRFLGYDYDIRGHHVTDLIENTRMHVVAETGIPEVGLLQKIKSNYMVVSRFPILKENKIIGAVGTVYFRNFNDFEFFYRKVISIKEGKSSVRQTHAKYTFNDIIGECEEIKTAKDIARQVANNSLPVLLEGESGTGKELFAHGIHTSGKRAGAPFVELNCAAIPSELFESELFGYTEGSFTGASRKGKKGKLEAAHRGTIFFDEIGELSLPMQGKLLRFLQEKEIQKIGSSKCISVDVRVIAATNRDLKEMVNKNLFRKDLYYRINVISITIPPLRRRASDIPLLSQKLLEKHRQELKKHNVKSIHPKTMNYFQTYHWPGNVRELENSILRALSFAQANQTSLIIPIYESVEENEAGTKTFPSLKNAVEQLERKLIAEALVKSNGNKVKAAGFLEISRGTLYEKMRQYSIAG